MSLRYAACPFYDFCKIDYRILVPEYFRKLQQQVAMIKSAKIGSILAQVFPCLNCTDML